MYVIYVLKVHVGPVALVLTLLGRTSRLSVCTASTGPTRRIWLVPSLLDGRVESPVVPSGSVESTAVQSPLVGPVASTGSTGPLLVHHGANMRENVG